MSEVHVSSTPGRAEYREVHMELAAGKDARFHEGRLLFDGIALGAGKRSSKAS